MWHEARKIEKRIRGIMIDYRRRAERRTAYYRKMREDPNQLLRLHGHKCKLYIDSRADKPTEESQLVSWQGDPDVLIDRFDARSHLDYFPEPVYRPTVDSAEDEEREQELNYERYRTLVQIEATGVTEEAYLKQLAIEEWYGKKQAEKAKTDKEEIAKKKASIGYKYEDSSVLSDDSDKSDDDDDSDLSDIDISVNVIELSEEQRTSLDSLATQFGVADRYYCRQLMTEKKEFEYAKQLEVEEEERSKLSGRRGKRARRTLREKQKATRTTSPPSYAMRESPSYDPYSPRKRSGSRSSSSSRSPSPDNHGKIEYITEFGGASNSPEKQKINSSRKVSSPSKSHRDHEDKGHRTHHHDRHHHRKRSDRSGSRGHSSRRHGSRDRDRSHSHGHKRSRSRSRSPRRRSRSRSRSGHRSTSGHRSRRRSRSHHRDRSRSRSSDRSYRRRQESSGDSHRLKSSSRRSRSYSRSVSRSRSRSRSRSPRSSTSSTISRKLDSSTSKKSQGVSAGGDKPKLTMQERLKLRMQKQLNKQIKQDKQTERRKKDEKERERADRDSDIYELQRRMRHRPRNDYYNRDRSRSPKTEQPKKEEDRSRSPSRSPRTRAYEEIGWKV